MRVESPLQNLDRWQGLELGKRRRPCHEELKG
jgi:hypothetical protein